MTMRSVRRNFRRSLTKNHIIPGIVFLLLVCVFSHTYGDEFNPYNRKLKRGVYLVASRNLLDPNFTQTVILLIEYNSQGAVGLIINRETDVRLRKVLPEMEMLQRSKDTVFIGGPVGVDQLLILVRADSIPKDAYRIMDELYVLSSLEVLEHMLKQDGEDVIFRAYAGYAGWAPGQLDSEVARGDWYVAAADLETVFSQEPESLWQQLIERSTAQWTKSFKQRIRDFSFLVEVAVAYE